jgi:hypothetical protein
MITATDRDTAILLDGEWQIVFDSDNSRKHIGWLVSLPDVVESRVMIVDN